MCALSDTMCLTRNAASMLRDPIYSQASPAVLIDKPTKLNYQAEEGII